MRVDPASTSQRLTVTITDDGGLPVTGLVAATFPATYYARAGLAEVAITLSDLAAITTGYTSGGVKEIGQGRYRLDAPDAAFATATEALSIIGEATDKRVIHPVISVAFPVIAPVNSDGVTLATDRGTAVATHVSGSGVRTYYTAASDTDAARGTAILAAQTAASDGTIYVYGDCTITSPLGKSTVNWDFEEGVTITATGCAVWDDLSNSINWFVFGDGVFVSTNERGVNLSGGGVVRIECRSITGTGSSMAGIYATSSSTCYVEADQVVSVNYDALWSEDGGKIYFDIADIVGGNNAIESTTSPSVVQGRAGRIRNTNSVAGAVLTAQAGGRIEVDCDRIDKGATSGFSRYAIINDGGVTIVRCPQINGAVMHVDDQAFGSVTTEIVGTTINSEGLALPTILANAAGLLLRDVSLVTDGGETNSLTAASAVTVKVIGGLKYNKVAHANVTIDYMTIGDAAGKVLGGGSGTITGTGARVVNSSGSSIQSETNAIIYFDTIASQNTTLATAITAVQGTANAINVKVEYTILETGTAQAGGASTITLAAADPDAVKFAGKIIVITAGTGIGQSRLILSGSGKVATVSRAWTTNPDSTSTYAVLAVGEASLEAWQRVVPDALVSGKVASDATGTGGPAISVEQSIIKGSQT